LRMDSETPHVLTEQDSLMLSSVANVAAIAIANSSFFDKERRDKDEALRTSQARLSYLLNNNKLAVVEWDNDFLVVNWTLAAEKIFGWTREEGIAHQYIGLVGPPAARPQVERVKDDLRNQVEVVHSINENITKDGQIITCEWYNVPVIDSDGNKLGYAAMAL